MGFQEVLNYALFTNSVSSNVGSLVWSTASLALSAASKVTTYLPVQKQVEVINMPPEPLWKLAASTGPYVKLAALSGAAAVILGAYGAHRRYPEYKQEGRHVFETASRYHFIHTLALLGQPLCKRPFLASTFFLSGIVLFCGTCYYSAFTDDHRLNKLTPIGGGCFIIGWLSMCI